MQIEGNPSINIIQGDTYIKEIQIENIDMNLIENVYFSSEKLNVCKILNREEDCFVLEFTSEETKEFPKIYTTYDLTVKFVGDSVKTILFCDNLNVQEKRNKVCYL